MAKKPKQTSMQKRKKEKKPISKTHEIISVKYNEIAALAWEGYQTEGRGFVLVQTNDIEGIDAAYVEREGIELITTDKKAVADMIEQVNTYNPEKELVIVNTVGKYLEVWIMKDDDLPPPLVYEMIREGLI